MIPRRAAHKLHIYRDTQTANLVGSMPEGMVVTDIAGNILDLNRAAVDLFGYSSGAELVGRNVRVLVPAPHAERHDGYVPWRLAKLAAVSPCTHGRNACCRYIARYLARERDTDAGQEGLFGVQLRPSTWDPHARAHLVIHRPRCFSYSQLATQRPGCEGPAHQWHPDSSPTMHC